MTLNFSDHLQAYIQMCKHFFTHVTYFQGYCIVFFTNFPTLLFTKMLITLDIIKPELIHVPIESL